MAKKERNPQQDLLQVWEQLNPDQQLSVFIALLKDLLTKENRDWLHGLMILLTSDFEVPDEF